MSTMKQVFLKLSSNHDALMGRLIKFHESINQTFMQKLNSEMYLESIQDGLLYIFRNYDAFKKVHKPIPKLPKFLKKRIFRINPEDEDIILGSVLRKESEFPPEGLKYYLTSETHNVQELFPQLDKHYKSIHPEIKTALELQNSRIIITFTTYQAFYYSFTLMNYFVEKAMESQHTTLKELYTMEKEKEEKKEEKEAIDHRY